MLQYFKNATSSLNEIGFETKILIDTKNIIYYAKKRAIKIIEEELKLSTMSIKNVIIKKPNKSEEQNIMKAI